MTRVIVFHVSCFRKQAGSRRVDEVGESNLIAFMVNDFPFTAACVQLGEAAVTAGVKAYEGIEAQLRTRMPLRYEEKWLLLKAFFEVVLVPY